MNGYDLYCTYQAIKLHFSSESYNFFHYDGKTRVSIDAFQKRRDKFLFHRLARKYRDDEMVPFLVANFVHSDDNWTKSLLEEEAEETYREWKRVTDSMTKIYEEDLRKIATKETFNDLFKVEDGQFPKLLTHFMHKDITIETMVILNNIFNFIQIWDKKISDDIIYPKMSRKIRKYGSFLNVNVDKYKSLTKKTLLANENAI
jgi:T4 gene Gp59 loader of gp41 DNA helicase/T4 gene Gp59 loader of gp41 DNA helicase C-term